MLKLVSFVLIVIVWGFYYLNFGMHGTLSHSSEVWGQFGDYVGGVVNPLLTFITIYLLVQSLSLQREANNTLINQIKKQEELEEYKKFEIRFFSLIEAQDNNFKKLRLLYSNELNDEVKKDNHPNLKVIPEVIELKASDAVNYIDDNLSLLVKAKIDREEIVEWLNSLDIDDHFFSIVRRFYLVVKLIDDKVSKEKKEEQYEALLNLTDMKILIFLVILCHYFDWVNIEYIRQSKILDKDGLNDYIKNYE